MDENVAIGSVIGSLNTLDPDSDSFTYALVEGEGSEDNELFAINGSEILTNSEMNYEEKQQYWIRLRTTDSTALYYEKIFEVTVRDVAERPTDIYLSSNVVVTD